HQIEKSSQRAGGHGSADGEDQQQDNDGGGAASKGHPPGKQRPRVANRRRVVVCGALERQRSGMLLRSRRNLGHHVVQLIHEKALRGRRTENVSCASVALTPAKEGITAIWPSRCRRLRF